jgi:ribosomal protein L40E
MNEFTFLGHTFSYPEGAEKSTALFGEWMEKASKAERTFGIRYDEQKRNYLNFVSVLDDEANKMLSHELEEVVGFLFHNGINSSEDEFISKYENEFSFSYETFIEPVITEFNEIQSYAESLDEQRSENSKIFHSQWEGGGFGLKGALKGAIQADILNAVQNGINSASESAQAEKDIEEINTKMREFYRNPQSKEIMCSAIYECYKNIYYALSKEMLEKGVLTTRLELNEAEAEKLFTNTLRFCKGDDIVKNLCKCIQLYPAKNYLEKIYSELPKEEDKNFQDFMNFWNLNFYGLNQVAIEKKNEEKRLAIEAENQRREEQSKIQKEKNEAEAARKQKLLSIRAAVATSYQEIFKGVDETYTNKVILSSHQEHMQKVIDFYEPDSTENPILAYDDTILNSGKKGFLLTDEKIHFTNDTQNGEITVFDIDEISDLTFKKGFVSPEICFNNCAVVTACLSSKYGALVEKLLEATLAILKNGKNIQQKPIASTETMIQQNTNASFCKACGAKLDAGAKFCKKCGHPVS